MNKVYTLSLTFLMLTGLYAKESKWHTLKPIDQYHVSDFTLKKNLGYLEIRQYLIDEHHKLKKSSYQTLWSFYRMPLKSFGSKKVKIFRKLPPRLLESSDIVLHDFEDGGIGCYYAYNGFAINKDGKMFRMNRIKDIIGFFGDIDTPAEAQVVLKLHNKHRGKGYRKTSQGYNIMIEYTEEYGDSQSYCKKLKYFAKISKQGKVTKYKLISSHKTKTYCMHVDWMPCD